MVPSTASQAVSALAIGDVAQVEETFSVVCTAPGPQEVIFTNMIAPVAATDPDVGDNVSALTIQVECLIPAEIRIRPRVVNLKSQGVIPVLVLSVPGFDATAIDPLSVHFGPADVLLGVEPPGGATEAHGRGHTAGDDLMLHFRVQESGLDATDTQACVKGEILVGGTWFTFFGCDDILVRP